MSPWIMNRPSLQQPSGDRDLVSDPNLILFTSSLHFRAWVKKTDSELEAAARAAQAEEDKDIPILPYSSLFILSSENK